MILQGTCYREGLETVSSCQVLCLYVSCVPDRARRTLYESKGLEFDDVSHNFLHVYPVADKIKVLLYNFFGDSTATLNQWRLVLNGVSGRDDLSDAPTFDETRHASICVEVCYLRPKHFYPFPFMLSGLAVEILVRRDHSGSEKPLDHGQFRVSSANEGARESYNLGVVLTLCAGTLEQ